MAGNYSDPYNKEGQSASFLKLGGSILKNRKGELNFDYLENDFLPFLAPILINYFGLVVIINGGGTVVRDLQKSMSGASNDDKDQAPKQMMLGESEEIRQVVENFLPGVANKVPSSPDELRELIRDKEIKAIVTSWIQKGQSTDGTTERAVREHIATLPTSIIPSTVGLSVVIGSDIGEIHDKNPDKFPDTRRIRSSSLDLLIKQGTMSDLISKREPGMNVPMTPESVAGFRYLEDQGYRPRIWYGLGTKLDSIRTFMLGEFPRSGTVLHADTKETGLYDEREAVSQKNS